MHPSCYMAKPTLRIPLALRHTVALQFRWLSTHQGIENYICEEIQWQKLGPWHCLETYEQLWRSSWSQVFRYVRQRFWEESSEFFHKHLFLRERPNQRYHLCQVYSWHGTSPKNLLVNQRTGTGNQTYFQSCTMVPTLIPGTPWGHAALHASQTVKPQFSPFAYWLIDLVYFTTFMILFWWLLISSFIIFSVLFSCYLLLPLF